MTKRVYSFRLSEEVVNRIPTKNKSTFLEYAILEASKDFTQKQ